MTCQSSYPLNSEKARPPGTCKEYLSCAASAIPAKTDGKTTMASAALMLNIARSLRSLAYRCNLRFTQKARLARSLPGSALEIERASPEREHASSQPIRECFATETQPPALLTGLQGHGFKRLAKALGVARP